MSGRDLMEDEEVKAAPFHEWVSETRKLFLRRHLRLGQIVTAVPPVSFGMPGLEITRAVIVSIDPLVLTDIDGTWFLMDYAPEQISATGDSVQAMHLEHLKDCWRDEESWTVERTEF